MPIHTIIHEKRKEQGLTQEQIASYLGVTAPAVNKWEKGTTYPDITLLAPLARLLRVDLNTLLCFQEGPSTQEINYFCEEAVKRVQTEDLDAGFQMMKQKIQEYPHCAPLVHRFALLLDSFLVLSKLSPEEKKKYEDALLDWYRRVADGDIEDLKINAAAMLASKYMVREEYEKAQEMIDLMPEYNMLDKRTFQADLYRNQKTNLSDASRLLQRKLMNMVMDLQGVLLRLVKTELAAGNETKAGQISDITKEVMKSLGLWDYYIHITPLEIALYQKNIPESIRLIDALLSSANHFSWSMENSPLYDQLGIQNMMAAAPTILPPLIASLKQSPEYDFLQGEEEFQKLLKKFSA